MKKNPAISQKLSARYIKAVKNKSGDLGGDIKRQTIKYLNRLERQERRLHKKLSTVDSLAALKIFSNSQERYAEVREQIKNRSPRLLRSNGQYVAWVDTSLNSLKFLESNSLAQKLPVSPNEIKESLAKVQELEDRLKQAENVKEFIRQRKEFLTRQLKDFKMGKQLQKFNKEAYYYSQQIAEYKSILNDPSKIEVKAISLLRKIPAFEKFMQENGMLAGLFNIPKDYATSMTGLQTINQVRSLFNERVSLAGPNGSQTVQQNIGAAQSALSQVRNRLSQGNPTGEMPNFKPNTQRTKSFVDRLEFGSNLQSTKSTALFPMTTDIGLSVGYKLNDKSVVGVGGSYKLGLGSNWNHVSISHQGMGMRSFIDFKLKGSIWISGGAELNYRSEFSDLSILKDYSPWQKSALLGLSKKYSVGKKFKGNLQLMYDFLHGQQVPKTQPVIFRVGYSFK